MNPRKKLILFISLVLFSSAILWGTLAILGESVSNLETGDSANPIIMLIYVLNGFMPSIIGVILILKTEPKEEKILSSLIPRKNQLKILAEIFILFICCFLIQVVLYELFIGGYDYTNTVQNLYQILPLFILGPLSEEIGWRGYMQKQVNKLTTPIKGSILIGVVWALWHLPLFFIKGTTQEMNDVSFFTFSFLVILLSWIMTFYYLKSKGNLFVSVSIHWIYTFVFSLFIISTTYSLKSDIISIIPFIFFSIYLYYRYRKVKSF